MDTSDILHSYNGLNLLLINFVYTFACYIEIPNVDRKEETILHNLLRYMRIPYGTNRFLANTLLLLPIGSVTICVIEIIGVATLGRITVSMPLLILAVALSLPSVITIPLLNIIRQRRQTHR